MSIKFTEELYVMAMKNDTKTEEELTCRFTTDMRNLTIFDPSTPMSKNICFNELLVIKVYNSLGKKVRRSYLS